MTIGNYILILLFSIFSFTPIKDDLVKLISNAKSIDEYISVIDIIKKENMLNDIPLYVPIKENYYISSEYGYREDPITQKKSFHAGIDFSTQVAAIVYASADGKVIFSGKKGSYGNCIIIKHKYGYSTLYGHLIKCYKKKGDIVKKGTPIGFVGSTGKSTGNHLHYEVIKKNKKIDPNKYLKVSTIVYEKK